MLRNDIEDFLAKLSVPQPCTGGCGATVHGPCICEECATRQAIRKRESIGSAALDSIPPRYRWACRESDLLTARVVGAGANIRRAVDAAESGKSILLIGESGMGKSSLACACLRLLIDAGRAANATDAERVRAHKARFFDAYSVAKARSQWPMGRGEAPDVELAIHASVLVLDELGSEQHAVNPVAEVIHEREADERQTIVTTWLKPSQLEERYGSGIRRRLDNFVFVGLAK